MAVELHIQMPVGHKTEDTRFLPGAEVRVAGRTTSVWGIPVRCPVDIHIRDAQGKAVQSLTMWGNFVGNFWWDTNLPTAAGLYTVFADAGTFGNASLSIEITPLATGPDFQIAVDPKEGWVGGAVRVTARIQIQNMPVQEAYVAFRIQAPSGAITSVDARTDSRGLAWMYYEVAEVGKHVVAVYSGVDGRWLTTYFTAEVPPDPAIIPEPIIPIPEPVPNGLDIGSLMGVIVPIMLLGLVMSMMKEM